MPGESKVDDGQHERHVYSYTYAADGDDDQTPRTNFVQMTTTVEEETTPDGIRVIRKREASQQLSKVTKVEKVTRVHRQLIEPSNGQASRPADVRYQALSNPSAIKHEMSGGFLPNSSYSHYDSVVKELANGMKHVDMNDSNADCYSNGRMAAHNPFNGNGYNEPDNNKSTALTFHDLNHRTSFCSQHGREKHGLRSERSEFSRRTRPGCGKPLRRFGTWSNRSRQSCAHANSWPTITR